MDQFVKPENQTLLWNAMNRNVHFSNMPEKELWFQQKFEFVYLKHRNYQQITLRELNHKTISFMMDELKKTNTPAQFQNTTPLPPTHHIPSNERMNVSFDDLQKEYMKMLSTPSPDVIDFKDKEDKPIDNINELVEKHRQEREQIVFNQQDSVVNNKTCNVQFNEILKLIAELKNILLEHGEEIKNVKGKINELCDNKPDL